MFPADGSGRLSALRLIPPDGMTIPNGSPSIFTADRLLLQTYCQGLEDEEIEQVLAAREELLQHVKEIFGCEAIVGFVDAEHPEMDVTL